MRARAHVGGARHGQSSLRGDYIDLAANSVVVRLQCRIIGLACSGQQRGRRLLLTKRRSGRGVGRPDLILHLITNRIDLRCGLLLIGLCPGQPVLARKPIKEVPGQTESCVPGLLVGE